MNKTIAGSLESIDQMMSFIDGLNDAEYQFCAKPWFDSSIGQHLRHIIDLYLALMQRDSIDTINYDVRRRGHNVENVRSIGLQELQDIRQWVSNLHPSELEQHSTVSTEVAITSQQTDTFSSSFGRELCFASSHLTHHLALMAVIAKMTGKDVDPSLGLAPATASHLREQASATCAR